MAGVAGDSGAIAKDLHARFDAVLAENADKELLADKICQVVESDGAFEKYAQVSRLPFPRQWKDQRVPQGVDVTNTLQSDNRTYEITVDFDEDLMQDAKAYELQDFVAETAQAWVDYPDFLLAALVEAGATSGNNGMSGLTFYKTTQSFAGLGNNQYSNKLTGTGTTLLQLQADFATALAALRNILDNAGKALYRQLKEGKARLLIQCPPALEYVFRQLLNTAWIPLLSGASGENIFKAMADLYSDCYLTDTNDWYLHVVGMSTKPFVYQKRRMGRTKLFTPDNDALMNERKIVRIAADCRFRLNYLFEYRSIRVTN